MMDSKRGIPLAFLLALAAGGAGAEAAAVSVPAEELLKPGSLRQLLPRELTRPAVRADEAQGEQRLAGCQYNYWRRC
jgi:hypothetical protein